MKTYSSPDIVKHFPASAMFVQFEISGEAGPTLGSYLLDYNGTAGSVWNWTARKVFQDVFCSLNNHPTVTDVKCFNRKFTDYFNYLANYFKKGPQSINQAGHRIAVSSRYI